MPLDGYRISPDAEQDLIEIWDYTTSTWSERQAEKYNAELFACFRMLVEFPNAGRLYEDLSYPLRVIVCNRHVVAYRVMDSELVIVNILNSRQSSLDILFGD